MQEKYRKKIDWVFFNEEKIADAVQMARIDTPRPEKVIGDPNKISDTTAQTALNNLTPLSSVIVGQREVINKKHERRLVGGIVLRLPELWLAVVDKTYGWCKRQSELQFQAVKQKYRGIHYHKICREFSISQSTLHNWIERTRMYAALQAAQFKLIYID